MPTYIFRGRAVLEGVLFHIEAETEQEAQALADGGYYSEVDADEYHTEMVDFEIRKLVEIREKDD